MDHLTDPSSGITFTSLRFLVIDEADRIGPMARQEWLEVVERRSGGLTRCASLADITASRWAPRKVLLSATLSRDVEDLHMWNLHQPRLFRANVSGSKEVNMALQAFDHVTGKLSLPSSIKHTVLAVEKQYHPLVLYLKIVEYDWQKVLVFTNEKESSQRLAILISRLARSKFKVEQLTGDLFGNRRAKVLKRFKTGTTRVLICSDVLSRGVDVEGIDCVVNYELPKNDRLFVHRAGRTGRAGRSGHVLSLGDGEERKIFVKNVLRKNGLWVNAEEEVVERSALENHLGRYEKALARLKKELIANKTISSSEKKPKVSGFAYRKKSRYHVIKEKLKAKNEKPWRKEKKDFVV
ncbi:helicase protein [Teladorsagia circumcincta]|uniref:ATP-dependent RNA helicase n=1 Tax=Teladorsagia circumcincta TaxID=45464 RepID=A0A2G9UDA5_TELCI|nr:helicase protein [Teladorsagia circumcincta]